MPRRINSIINWEQMEINDHAQFISTPMAF